VYRSGLNHKTENSRVFRGPKQHIYIDGSGTSNRDQFVHKVGLQPKPLELLPQNSACDNVSLQVFEPFFCLVSSRICMYVCMSLPWIVARRVHRSSGGAAAASVVAPLPAAQSLTIVAALWSRVKDAHRATRALQRSLSALVLSSKHARLLHQDAGLLRRPRLAHGHSLCIRRVALLYRQHVHFLAATCMRRR
jgi:hypothetical protein